MAQYKTGTVAVTNGSAAVVGTGTAWLTEVSAGDLFIVFNEGITYEIGSVTDDTHLTLAANYAGVTGSALEYAIARDFTPVSGLPYPIKGDIETSAVLKRALLMLDGPAPSTYSMLFDREHNGQGQHSEVTVQSGLTLGGTRRTTFPGLSYDAEHNTAGEHTDVTVTGGVTLGGVQRTTWPDPGSGSQALQDVLNNGYVATTTPHLPNVEITAQTINPAWPSAVDCCISSDSQDTDLGAWRKRCSDKSWYNETRPTGRYLGIYITEAAARAAGGTTEDWYARTTTVAFYKLNATSGETQIYRAGSQEFPAEVAMVAWADKVVLFDLTQPGSPMWMMFNAIVTANWWATGASVTSISLLNEYLIAGSSGSGIRVVNFAKDGVISGVNVEGNNPTGGISLRNSAIVWGGYGRYVIINNTVNDCAITVLDNAPIDIATGLPTPTIVVATAGGPSWITDAGSVWDGTGGISCVSGDIQSDGLSVVASTSKVYVFHAVPTADIALTSANYTFDTAATAEPAISGTIKSVKLTGGNTIVVATSTGLFTIVYNRTTPANSLINKKRTTHGTGWLPGAVKGCWMADSVAETITGTELVTNGTFDTDTAGWTGNNATLSVVSGAMRITAVANGVTEAYQAITCVVGKTYTASMDVITDATTGSMYLGIGTTTTGIETASSILASGTGKLNVTFVATQTTHYLKARGDAATLAAEYFDVDNISCRLAVADRSVNNKGLQVFGSLTKAAVATGASTMGYSGYSTSNYLQQPYNAGLDFGTGDFCFVGWLKESPNSAVEIPFSRGYHNGSSWVGSYISTRVNATGTFTVYISDDGAITQDSITSDIVVDDSVWRMCWIIRRGTKLELWFGKEKAATDVTIVNAIASLSNTSATLQLGRQQYDAGPNPLTNGTLALWRAMAYAPTAEQVKFMYETEKMLFQPNAQGILPGTSDSILSLGFDETMKKLYGHTSYGSFGFKDLLRVESEATAVGTPTCVAAHDGTVIQGGSTAIKAYVPALSLRAELERKAEQVAAFGSALEGHYFLGATSVTTFAMPVGWKPKFVYNAGVLVKEGAADQYTIGFDGFIYSVIFAVAPTAGNNICVMATREVR